MSEQLATIGALLKKAREERSLSLDEVEIQTKIRVKFIEALETGNLDDLPSNAHARGFLRNYAQFLYLDVDDIVAQFNEALGVEHKTVTTLTAVSQPAVSAFTKDQFESDNQPRRERKTTFVHPTQRIGPAAPRVSTPEEIKDSRVGIFAKLRAAVKAAQFEEEPPEEAVEEAPVIEKDRNDLREILKSTQFTIGMFVFTAIVLVIWITISLSRLDVDAIVPTPQDSEVLDQFTQGIGSNSTITPTFSEAQTPEETTGSLQIYDRVVLTITVESRAWTKIVVDGVVEFEGQADPGMVLQYEGSESIIVITGNGGGLSVTFNGQKLGLMGERGQVVERIFTVSGPVTPTPAPSPTATNTPVPTPTTTNP